MLCVFSMFLSSVHQSHHIIFINALEKIFPRIYSINQDISGQQQEQQQTVGYHLTPV